MTTDERDAVTALLPPRTPDAPLPQATAQLAALRTAMTDAPRQATYRRFVPVPVLAAAAVLLVLLGAVLLGRTTERPSDVDPATSPVTTAEELLERADAMTRATPPVDVRADQYVFTRSRARDSAGFRDVWLSADASRGLLRESGSDTPLDSAAPPAGLSVTELAIDYPSATSLRALADTGVDPKTLVAEVRANINNRQNVFDALRAMLVEVVVPPKLRATIYRAMLLVENVRFTRDALDGAGRSGVGLVHTGEDRTVIVIDPVTTAFLGTDDSAVISSAVVDEVAQYPAGITPQSGTASPPPQSTSLRDTDWENSAIGLPDDGRFGPAATQYIRLDAGQAGGRDPAGRPVRYVVDVDRYPPAFGPLLTQAEDAVLVLEIRPASGPSSWAVIAYVEAGPARLVTWIEGTAPRSVTLHDRRVTVQLDGGAQHHRWDGDQFVRAT
ncbi:hypothetical protein [Cryptosporangium minutisporangium]|uniref:Uncharacterized protein n=1 Tax=Cryptosporangium minutisporangium TaxID=113569 RepID=A0ABP6TBX6_9ACTN